MPDLDRQLRETGARLFDEIRIPDLDLVRTRARRIRQRRRGLAAGASTLAVLLVVGLGLTSLDRLTGGPEPVPAASDPTGTLWQGGGLTLHGLDGPVLDQPGDLVDIQFADSKHGYAFDRRVHPGLPGRARGDHRRRPLVVGLAHARRRRHRRPAGAADHGRRRRRDRGRVRTCSTPRTPGPTGSTWSRDRPRSWTPYRREAGSGRPERTADHR